MTVHVRHACHRAARPLRSLDTASPASRRCLEKPWAEKARNNFQPTRTRSTLTTRRPPPTLTVSPLARSLPLAAPSFFLPSARSPWSLVVASPRRTSRARRWSRSLSRGGERTRQRWKATYHRTSHPQVSREHSMLVRSYRVSVPHLCSASSCTCARTALTATLFFRRVSIYSQDGYATRTPAMRCATMHPVPLPPPPPPPAPLLSSLCRRIRRSERAGPPRRTRPPTGLHERTEATRHSATGTGGDEC